MDYKEILKYDLKKINEAITCLNSVNVIDYNTLNIKKSNQRRINKGYSLMFDVKMDLEKILKNMGEEDE